jgi:hypothetical protein
MWNLAVMLTGAQRIARKCRRSPFRRNAPNPLSPLRSLCRLRSVRLSAAVLFVSMLTRTPLLAQPAKLDTAGIDAAIGAKGTIFEAEGVYKVSFPRTDVPITVEGRKMEPFMGFTSWASFQPGKSGNAMVMGDLVLFEDEVNPTMSAALGAGIQVTALHNHFLFDQPKVYFMHIGGEGKAEELAAGVKRALDAARQVREKTPQPATSFGLKGVPTSNAITAVKLDEVLGVKGTSKDGMYKAVIGRTVQMSCGCEVGREMGVNTWAAFAGTDETALVDGDFAVLETELQSVLKSLRHADINIVAIHQHMVGESPRILFLHYWGIGAASELAKGVRSALDSQKAAPTAVPGP